MRPSISSGLVRAPSIASSRPEVVRSPEASAIVASGNDVAELSVIIVAPMLGVVGAIVKDDLRFADLNAATGGQRHSAFDRAAVVKRAVGGAEILQEILLAFATHFSVHSRRKRIGNAEIVAG